MIETIKNTYVPSQLKQNNFQIHESYQMDPIHLTWISRLTIDSVSFSSFFCVEVAAQPCEISFLDFLEIAGLQMFAYHMLIVKKLRIHMGVQCKITVLFYFTWIFDIINKNPLKISGSNHLNLVISRKFQIFQLKSIKFKFLSQFMMASNEILPYLTTMKSILINDKFYSIIQILNINFLSHKALKYVLSEICLHLFRS